MLNGPPDSGGTVYGVERGRVVCGGKQRRWSCIHDRRHVELLMKYLGREGVYCDGRGEAGSRKEGGACWDIKCDSGASCMSYRESYLVVKTEERAEYRTSHSNKLGGAVEGKNG